MYNYVYTPADSESIYEASKILLEPNCGQLIASLKCGQAIFKEVMGPVPYGMLVTTNYEEPSCIIPSNKFDQHPFTKERGINEIPGFKENLDRLINEFKNSQLRQSSTGKIHSTPNKLQINKQGRVFLDNLSLRPYETVHTIFSRMENMSNGAQEQILKNLVKLKLIKVTDKIRTGKMFVRFASFTEKGLKFLNKE